MKRILALLLIPLALAAAGAPQQLVLKHATIIDVTGGPVRPDSTVVISGNRITSIGQSGKVPVPQGAQVVDATGKFVIPGLWDMHVHWEEKDYLPLFIANGVTGVRIMWGEPAHHEWRKEIEAGQLLGPRMVIASPIIDGPKPYWPLSISVSTEAQARQVVNRVKQDGADFVKVYQFLPREEYFAIADESKKQGIPFVGHVPMPVSAEEASRAGQKSFEHLIGILPACSNRRAELTEAAQADFAEDLVADHPKFWGTHVRDNRQLALDSYDPDKAAALFAELKRNGTWQCPTLTLLRMFGYGDDPAFLKDPRLKYMPRQVKARWDPSSLDGDRSTEDFAMSRKEFRKDLEIVVAMQKAGVGILAGTDTLNPFCFPGFSLHDELGLLVQAGLSPVEALRAATLSPAEFLGKEKDLGTVEPGKLADLVLLDANPLDDIANTRKIAGVIYDGKLYPKASLDAMLAKAEALSNRKSPADVLLRTIQEKDMAAAVRQFLELKTTQSDVYDFSEAPINLLGYRLLALKKFKAAIEILKLNAEAYPDSFNAYDSLAEAYMDDGDKELAIANYQKSLQLNPDNANAVAMLKKLNAP
jgi:hypothetical protein